MLAVRTAVLACLVLAACDGNPFVAKPGAGPGNATVSTLPGTDHPTAAGAVTRYEEHGKGPNTTSTTDGTATGTGSAPDVLGNGFAFQDGKINYNKRDDTFEIDNLAFDGGNVYTRSPAFLPSADPEIKPIVSAQVYEGAGTVPDNQTGALIDQFSYRALYGASASGKAHFAIVRTGAYRPYGFGGFVYNRTGSVGLPELEAGSNQAKYSGTYSGLRDFAGKGGLQVTSGDMELAIDFKDFNPAESGLSQASAIYGSVTNRRVFDLAGNDITTSVLAEINADKSLTEIELPALQLFTGPGHLDVSGEAEGNIDSTLDGEQFEAGKYYAVLSGDKAQEIVGVIVVTASIGKYTARETGGFILYHK